MKELPSVFAFLDHRIFLREWFEAKKALSASYSYRVFARKAGFASHAFLSEVMQGRRNLSEDSVEKFLKALALVGPAADYFRLLVHYGQESNLSRREDLLSDLVRCQATQAVGRVGKKQEAYYGHWIHAVVRELAVQLEDPTAQRIASRLAPAASPEEVAQSLELLESLELLVPREGGGWDYGVSARLTPGDVPTQVLRSLKRQYFLMVQDRIASGTDPDLHASSVILSVSKARMCRIREILDRTRREILAETASDEDPTERVALVNFQLVPLTRSLFSQE
ncbi:MAG: hypothetical protein RL318_2584 [Fibrobacterota bacterium]